jgi:Thermostable hemolysin
MLQAEVANNPPLPACAATGTFTNVPAGSLQRAALEARIRTGFGAHFGACVEGFMPTLAKYQHVTGAKGVIGVRRASEEALFLETYLDDPVEAAIARVAGRAVARCAIAEIGQFVVDRREIVGDFFLDLVPYLAEQGFEWACFTGTSRIRRIVARLGLAVMPLATADRTRLGESQVLWGNYYEHDPVVVAGRVGDPFGDRDRTTPATRFG